MVHSRMLAWSPDSERGLLSDMADPILGGVDMKETKRHASPEPANLWNVFVSGNVVLAQDFSDPSAGTAHADATTGAVQLGVDYRITPNFLVGAMFGYGHTDATLDTLGSTASVDTYSPGVYASYSKAAGTPTRSAATALPTTPSTATWPSARSPARPPAIPAATRSPAISMAATTSIAATGPSARRSARSTSISMSMASPKPACPART
jgi:hypothetical protein